jgi:gluconolactonase
MRGAAGIALHARLPVLLAAALAAALAGCAPHAARTAPAEPAPAVDRAAWRCPADPGVAPSGTLRATRIAAATATDTLPRLYEGPVWRDSALYFSDFELRGGFRSRIRRFTPPGRLETVLEDSGSNGLAMDAQGWLLAATHDRKQLARVDLTSGAREALVGTYLGQPFNSPNDLAVAGDGTVYFTDPDFQAAAAPGGQPRTRVYRFSAGAVDVVDDSIANPNGIALSPDQRMLYVSGGGESGTLRAYPLRDGAVGPGTDLASASVPDGLAVDCLGNVYLTEHTLRRIRVLNPAGTTLATIEVDANVTNAAFGGADGRTLYITGAGALWALPLQVAGLPY